MLRKKLHKQIDVVDVGWPALELGAAICACPGCGAPLLFDSEPEMKRLLAVSFCAAAFFAGAAFAEVKTVTLTVSKMV